jgi:hypothetical protein
MLLPKGVAIRGLVNYANICGVLGALISAKLATLNELQTVYSLEDAYLLYEIINVNSYNERMVRNGNYNR